MEWLQADAHLREAQWGCCCPVMVAAAMLSVQVGPAGGHMRDLGGDLCSEGRMIYPQPDTLIQTRPDVLTMTPWFAPIVWQGTYNRDILNEQFKLRHVTVGLTVFAIKKYVVFLQVFLETAEKFFMVGHNVNYYVFTDHPDQVPNITLASGRQIITLLVPAHKRWQEVTMRRMDMLHNASRAAFINQVDYIVAVDVDMQFSDVVGVEILGDLFGTLHPGFYNGLRQQFTYERRPASQAYIPLDEGDFYYAGGFFGGTVREVYKLTGYCHKAMMMDKEKGIEAVWHDESYLNKYFVGKKPSKILSPEYLWDNNMGSQTILTNKRFMAVAKNHIAIRNKYVVFLQLFLETAEKFFMVGHNVSYYVFTDHPDQVPNITLAPGRQIITLLVPAHKRWQEVSMRRMEMLHNASRAAFINQVDYIVAVDVDMQFSDVVGVEILGDLFGTLHPGFYRGLRQHFTYERRPASQAYIPLDEGDFYYAGGFFGGTVREVYKLTGYCHKVMMMDKEKGIEAVWHDESYLNKYFVGKKPSKILSPEYLWDNNMGSLAILRNKRFIAVPKNHAAIRNK